MDKGRYFAKWDHVKRGEDAPLIRGNGDEYALCDIFARLLKLTEVETLQVLSYVMAESLEVGNASVEALGNLLSVSLGDVWTPDEAFFDQLREKQTINAMLAEIAGQSVADANIAETAKVQKGIIVDTLNGTNGRTAKPDWRPRWAAFPFGTYRSGEGLRPAAAWRKVSRLFAKTAQSRLECGRTGVSF